MTVSLKEGPLIAITGDDGSISTGQDGAHGLYYHDMRFLSAFELRVNGRAPQLLSNNTVENHVATFQLVNPPLELPDGSRLPRQTLSIRRTRFLADGWRERIGILNCAARPVTLHVDLELDADFRDLFALRGYRADEPAAVERRATRDGLRLRSAGRDGTIRETHVATIPAPSNADRTHLRFDRTLEPEEVWSVEVRIAPREGGRSVVRTRRRSFDAAIDGVGERYRRFLQRAATYRTSSERLDGELLERSARDLCALVDDEPSGPVPTAGIPWFATVFGRDALIAGFQTLAWSPDLARGTIRFLARHQGRLHVPDTEEEPGKIFHEIRRGELARRGLVPHRPYFGSVDATPLFAWLVAETIRWTGDRRLWREHRPAVEAALDWCRTDGDPDGDGFVEYAGEGDWPLRNKGWKDSADSIAWLDGQPAERPIALVEVQGYAYAARRAAADLLEADGERDAAVRLRDEAAALRDRFDAAFWLPDEAFYAQGLDAAKQPVRAATSNAGHALWSGIARAERAPALVARLMAADLFSGWGVRTLSAGYPTFNPMSYHNGSIWPHDNSLLVAGFVRYGAREAANAIVDALFEAARHLPDARLPEVFCGFARDRRFGTGPAEYLVSCSPQAWSAAAPFLLLRSVLDLRADPASGSIVCDPVLPESLDQVEVRGLRALGRRWHLSVRRTRQRGLRVSGSIVRRPRRSPDE